LLPLPLLWRHSVSACALHGRAPLLLGLLLLLLHACHTCCGLLPLGPPCMRRGCRSRSASCSCRTDWRCLCLLLHLLLLGLLLPSHLVRLLLEGGPAGLRHKRGKAVEQFGVGAQQRQRRRQQARHILVLLVGTQLCSHLLERLLHPHIEEQDKNAFEMCSVQGGGKRTKRESWSVLLVWCGLECLLQGAHPPTQPPTFDSASLSCVR
jgi:hypothetical protein